MPCSRQAVDANEARWSRPPATAACRFRGRRRRAGAALAAQQAFWPRTLARNPAAALRVRMGVHTGEAESAAGDYFGPALNRARAPDVAWARRAGAGLGGWRKLVRDSLPEAAQALLDLGEHRLKDLTRPEHVYQLAHPRPASQFPAAKVAGRFPQQPARAAHQLHRARARDGRSEAAAV